MSCSNTQLNPTSNRPHAPRQKRDEVSHPDWYWRIVDLEFRTGRAYRPSDFDYDLSDLEEPMMKDGKAQRVCHCGEKAMDKIAASNGGCDCGRGDFDDGSESERSYDGSDAEEFYEMKAEREIRKREIRELRASRPSPEELKKKMIEAEKKLEAEALVIYEALKEKTPGEGGGRKDSTQIHCQREFPSLLYRARGIALRRLLSGTIQNQKNQLSSRIRTLPELGCPNATE